MALIDNQNKVIYWDEVNWQWIPFVAVSGRKIKVWSSRRGSNTYISVNSKEEALGCLIREGYSLLPLSSLGIIEISVGCYSYEGKVYRTCSSRLRTLPSLLSMISGKSTNYIKKQLNGKKVVSKSLIDRLVYENSNIEFRGKVYTTYNELAKDYSIPLSYLSMKLSNGISLEDAINSYKVFREDHLGNKFNSEREMCKYWGISYNTYRARKSGGWSLEKALTTPSKKSSKAKECKDIEGNIFPSITSMAKAYNVTQPALTYYIKKGKTPAEALKHLLTEGKVNRKVFDHKGTSFSSNTEMAKYYNVNRNTFRDRMKNGWTLEEALTGKRG